MQANVELYRDDRSGFSYRIPDSSDIDTFRAAIEALPGQESPEVYGLHPNADLTFRTLQVRAESDTTLGPRSHVVVLLTRFLRSSHCQQARNQGGSTQAG